MSDCLELAGAHLDLEDLTVGTVSGALYIIDLSNDNGDFLNVFLFRLCLMAWLFHKRVPCVFSRVCSLQADCCGRFSSGGSSAPHSHHCSHCHLLQVSVQGEAKPTVV